MKFYRLHRMHEAGISVGYEYFSSKRAAERDANHWLNQGDELEHEADIDTIEIKPTKGGILAALNKYATHADNG